MFFYRMPSQTDIHELMQLDIKCFYEPWTRDIWEWCLATYFARVATYNRRIVGIVVGGLDTDEPTQFRVMKVGVDPRHRRRGMSIDLLKRVADYAREKGASSIDAWMPEHYIYPTDAPWCVLPWLEGIGASYVEMKHEMYENQGYLESGLRWEIAI